MKGFKRYERYKDSGVEWIGEIPEHWNLSRFKNYIKLINEKVESNELDLHYVGLENIESFTGKLIEGASYIGEGVSIIFTPKDVLFGKLRPYLAKVLLPSFNGRCSTELLVLRPIDNSLVDRSYLYYYCLSDGFINIVNSSTYGARMPRTSWDFISLLTLTLPSLHEQKAIAIFLNQKTAEIDSLIADKEKLIELLQEQRQAIITQAVTKGLDPNVPMKDSGVEWIGEIPEHWDICKIKYIVNKDKNSIKAGPFGSQLKSEDIIESGIKVYNQANVIKKDLSICSDYISEKKYKELEAFTVFENDILVTSRGTIGRVVIVTSEAEKGVLHPCLLKMSINTDLYKLELIDFIFNETRIVQNQIEFLSNATTIDVIYTDTLKNIILPFPPKEEQDSILNYIYQKVKEIDSLVFSISNQLGKLKEYRQSLITAAVTGKIDVRDYIVDNDKEEGEEQEEVS